MPREEMNEDEIIELAESYFKNHDLNVLQEILIGKFILWLRSFQCPDSYQADTAYGMMWDVWESIEEYLGVS